MDGIVVSNHGGRQVDGALASIDALAEIMTSRKVLDAQASGKLTVLFDSGIRTGVDIVKALALGAQGVLRMFLFLTQQFISRLNFISIPVGRPFMYGLCLAGEQGVDEQIKIILSDFEITLGLSGYKDIAGIQGNRSALRHQPHASQ